MSPHNGGAGGGSGNGPQLEITGMERRFTQECVNEAFWRRSLPLSGIGVYATYMAAIKGKIGHK